MVGFDAIWSSSFEISASYCVPDASILSMSEYLHIAQSIASSVSIPVIADCDTGYGNAANVAYTVKRFESAGVAGISIEDQVFPKANSLMHGVQQLISVGEFTDKICAAKDAQVDPDFVVIARVEALIAGAGQEEAQWRATEYAAAGADAVLIHWNQSSFEPIRAFLEEWSHSVPVVVVPTTYYSVSRNELAKLGAKMVIYANHGIRSALSAIEDTLRSILQEGSADVVEHALWSVNRIFEQLQDVRESKRVNTGEALVVTPRRA